MTQSHRYAAALAGVLFTGAAALAQSADEGAIPIMPDGGMAIGIDITPGLSGPGHEPPYLGRVVQPVYQTSDTTPYATGFYSLYTMEDISFAPGPWAPNQTRSISQFQW